MTEHKTFLIPYDRHGNSLVGIRGGSTLCGEEAGPSEEIPYTPVGGGSRGLIWSVVMSDTSPWLGHHIREFTPEALTHGPITP